MPAKIGNASNECPAFGSLDLEFGGRKASGLRGAGFLSRVVLRAEIGVAN